MESDGISENMRTKMRTNMRCAASSAIVATLLLISCTPSTALGQDIPRYFISVDMEGIGGIGTGKMTSSAGKDYQTGRRFMTDEVNAVVAAIFSLGDAEILVNDSHGDMQNLIHADLDPRVEYIQGNIKPLGMVQGLDDTFDAALFIGYHARAGTPDAFLAHTGSGSVKGLWLNGIEVGEGGMNAAYAGAHGVPVIFASGDLAFADQFQDLTGAKTLAVKTAIGAQVARLTHPDVVRERLHDATLEALKNLDNIEPFLVGNPVTVRMKFASTTRADILQAVPGMRRIDGYTIEIDAANMDEGYRVIRLMYKYISW